MFSLGIKKAVEFDHEVSVSVTEFSWSVSKIINYVKKHKHPVHITRRNEIVAVISPVDEYTASPQNHLPSKRFGGDQNAE